MKILDKNFLAVIIGLFVVFALSSAIKWVNYIIFIDSLIVNFKITDMQSLRNLTKAFPLEVWIVALVGWAISCLVGGYTVARLSVNRSSLSLPLVLGIILLAMGVGADMFLIPGVQPMWVVSVSWFFALALPVLGSRFARRD